MTKSMRRIWFRRPRRRGKMGEHSQLLTATDHHIGIGQGLLLDRIHNCLSGNKGHVILIMLAVESLLS